MTSLRSNKQMSSITNTKTWDQCSIYQASWTRSSIVQHTFMAHYLESGARLQVGKATECNVFLRGICIIKRILIFNQPCGQSYLHGESLIIQYPSKGKSHNLNPLNTTFSENIFFFFTWQEKQNTRRYMSFKKLKQL